MKKPPLHRVNEQYGSKDKLVDALLGAIERGDEDKETLRKRLLSASNTKLMQLMNVATQMKQHGGKDKLVEEIAKLQNRSKDADYKTRLRSFTPGRLLDLYQALERAQKRTSAPKAPTSKKKGKAA